jgi:hypothetical protein
VADERMTTGPHDRVTRLAAVARDAMRADPEWNEETDKLFISLDDGDKGGFYTHGYSGPAQLARVLMSHIQALANASANMN